MASGRPSTMHACPGKCGRQVQRVLFACSACWHRLPRELQERITENNVVNPGAHLAAMAAACDWYRQHASRAVEEERCKHEMLPGQCSICKGLADPEELALEVRAELLASGDWLAARYAGRCDGCGRSFPKGASIRMAGRGWRAECCSEEDGDHRG